MHEPPRDHPNPEAQIALMRIPPTEAGTENKRKLRAKATAISALKGIATTVG